MIAIIIMVIISFDGLKAPTKLRYILLIGLRVRWSVALAVKAAIAIGLIAARCWFFEANIYIMRKANRFNFTL
jgi:hypothetical protein